ncbi:MAG: hypothetical protein EAX96_12660 [Candidatus Lokiarchaeota archaeon]|nr:hypothetical protein [Candidatus Lokiarchaeota archaeon]
MAGDRPLGTTIMAVIYIIVGILFVIVGILMATMAASLVAILVSLGAMNAMLNTGITMILGLIQPYLTIIGIVIIVGGILNFLGAIGIIALKPWGWIIAVICSIAYIAVIIGIIFLWYLFQDDTKTAFGKY